MAESPIFVKTYDLIHWLVPRTLKFPREHRFLLVERIQTRAFDLQRALLFAVKAASPSETAKALQRADVELAELKLSLRLASDLTLLDAHGYAHVARLTDEIGKLLGGWQRTLAR